MYSCDKRNALINMILQHEGGYVNDSCDNGGETYRGISRKSNPNWNGWEIVDSLKPVKRGEIIKNCDLEVMVIDFYDEKYYQRLRLDEISDLMISGHLLCQSVHSGRSAGVKCLQRSINAVLGANTLRVDGIIGNKTISKCNELRDNCELTNEIVMERKKFYKSVVDKNPSQKKFYQGWINRVDNTTRYINGLKD